ncbi:hypothetical protein MRX96_051582, partial [Rhipicephalus microplus]
LGLWVSAATQEASLSTLANLSDVAKVTELPALAWLMSHVAYMQLQAVECDAVRRDRACELDLYGAIHPALQSLERLSQCLRVAQPTSGRCPTP